jgi:hypothetical protein
MLKKIYTEHVIKDQLARVIYNRLDTIGNSIGTNKLRQDNTQIKYLATKTLILSSLKYIRGTW